MKKLYKSKSNRVFTGVLGGLGEYITLDPIILRIAFVVITLATGFFPMAFAYLLSIFLIPEETNGPKIYDVG